MYLISHATRGSLFNRGATCRRSYCPAAQARAGVLYVRRQAARFVVGYHAMSSMTKDISSGTRPFLRVEPLLRVEPSRVACQAISDDEGQAGQVQQDARSLEKFRQLLARTADQVTKEVLQCYQQQLVSNGAVSERALQGLTKEELVKDPFKLLAGHAAILKLAFPGPPARVPQKVTYKSPEQSPWEGIQARGDGITPRTKTVQRLLAKANTFGFMLLRGLPGSGKTSLLELALRLVQEERAPQFCGALYVNLAHITQAGSWEQAFSSQTGLSWSEVISGTDDTFGPVSHQRPVLLLADELHAAYGKPSQCAPFWGYIKSLLQGGLNSRIRIVAAAMYGLNLSGIPTPIEFHPRSVMGMQATADNELQLQLLVEEYQQLWERLWGSQPGWVFKGYATRDTIFRETNGLPSSIMWIMNDLKQTINGIANDSIQRQQAQAAYKDTRMGLGDSLLSNMFRRGSIYESLKSCRSFLDVQALSDVSAPAWTLLQRLMQAGLAAAVAGLPIRELPRAELQVLHELQRDGRLSVSEDDQLYCMPSTLHWRYCQYQLQQARVPDVDASKPASMAAFLQLLVQRMSASRLRTTLRTGVDGRVLEDKYQLEFVTAALSILPRGYNICPEVMGDASYLSEEGNIDFWVSPLDWGFELLWDGKEISAHEGCFDEGGQYSRYPWGTYGWAEYAVIDFCSAAAARPLMSTNRPNTYLLFFSEDFATAMLFKAATGEQKTFSLAP